MTLLIFGRIVAIFQAGPGWYARELQLRRVKGHRLR